MRNKYNTILTDFFSNQLIQSRNELRISQEKMAHLLSMSVRSYIDLEHGKNGCSGLTLALYLLYVCSDQRAFLNKLKDTLENK